LWHRRERTLALLLTHSIQTLILLQKPSILTIAFRTETITKGEINTRAEVNTRTTDLSEAIIVISEEGIDQWHTALSVAKKTTDHRST
jgi:hypothetical protein